MPEIQLSLHPGELWNRLGPRYTAYAGAHLGHWLGRDGMSRHCHGRARLCALWLSRLPAVRCRESCLGGLEAAFAEMSSSLHLD